MDVDAGLDAPCDAATVFARVDELHDYPAWMSLVHRAEPLGADGDGRPMWQVELRARVGPLARSKRLRMVRTLHDPDGGQVRFEGRPVTGLEPHEIVRLGICHSPEGRRIFPRLSVRENLELGGFTRSDRAEMRRDIDEVCGLFPVLGSRMGQMGGTLSGGEQQMLALGRALVGRPRLLLLDEPSLGLAPLVVAKIFEVIAGLSARGIAVVLVEQNARAALKLASRGYVLETGRITLTGSGTELAHDRRVRDAYLGEG